MQADLIKQISGTIGKPKVVKLSRLLAKNNISPAELIAITFHNDKGVAFRAAWLLENVFLQNPECFLPHLSYFIDCIKEVKNPGCKRHYAKILMHLTAPNAPQAVRQYIKDINLEPGVEQCFDWIIDAEVLVAVKSFAAEALFNMRHRYPWIADELPNQLEFLMRDGSAAIQSKGRRLLSYLNPERLYG
jgi:hypothetical protein